MRQVDHINFIQICLMYLFSACCFCMFCRSFICLANWDSELVFRISLQHLEKQIPAPRTKVLLVAHISYNKAWVRRVVQLFQWYQWCSYFWEFKVISGRPDVNLVISCQHEKIHLLFSVLFDLVSDQSKMFSVEGSLPLNAWSFPEKKYVSLFHLLFGHHLQFLIAIIAGMSCQ